MMPAGIAVATFIMDWEPVTDIIVEQLAVITTVIEVTIGLAIVVVQATDFEHQLAMNFDTLYITMAPTPY